MGRPRHEAAPRGPVARCAIWGMHEEGDDEGTGRWYYTRCAGGRSTPVDASTVAFRPIVCRCSDPPDAGHKDIVALKNESDEVSRQDVWLSVCAPCRRTPYALPTHSMTLRLWRRPARPTLGARGPTSCLHPPATSRCVLAVCNGDSPSLHRRTCLLSVMQASMISFTGACLKSWAAPNAIKTVPASTRVHVPAGSGVPHAVDPLWVQKRGLTA